jgi:hypothetical protein
MDEQQQDLELTGEGAEQVKGGIEHTDTWDAQVGFKKPERGGRLRDPGMETQHNETLIRV